MGEELRWVGDAIDATRPPARAALVMSYESRWALKAVLTEPRMDALSAARRYHEALMARNICTDAMDPREDLSRYALVIAPRLYCVDARVAANLRQFVAGGGVLCLTPRSGVVDEFNKVFDEPAPGVLREIAGVEADDYGALEEPVPLRDQVGEFGPSLEQAEVWAEEMVPTTARVLAAYDRGWLRDMPAITLNEFGGGKVVCVGTVLAGDTLSAFVAWLCRLSGAAPVLETPPGVRALERRGEQARFLFLLNFTDASQSVRLAESWEDAVSGERVAAFEIPAIDMRILTRPA